MIERPFLFKFKRGIINIVQNGILWGHSIFVGDGPSGSVNKRSKIFVASDIKDSRKFHDYVVCRLCNRR
jgi:hypothetical protein